MNTVIRTMQQLHQVQADAWVCGLIVCGVAIALTILIAFLIPWRSDRKDYAWRRICFIVIGVALPSCYWLYNYLEIAPQISNPGFRSMFLQTNLYVLLVSFVIYAIVGIALMFCFRMSKLGAILGKVKN